VKIVIAPDSFKGCMTSAEAGSIIADAFREVLHDAEIVVMPMADGGEGTTRVVVEATGGEERRVEVTGPMGEPVEAVFGLLADGRTAVVEMASASGIELVPPGELDPMRTTTFGTGELIVAALDAGAREIVIGLGGSATVDGGAGMAQALGYGLLTAAGVDCGWGGGALSTLAAIDALGVVPELAFSRVRAACDVTNPLLGHRGAARVFGPQKGASPEQIEALERGLSNLADVWRREGLLEVVDRPGDGAAGGLGAGLRAFCRAELVGGAELVADITGFDDEIRDAELLVTGEGRTDAQTAGGKLSVVLAGRARAFGVRTILISGAVDGDLPELEGLIDDRFSCVDSSLPHEEAVRHGRDRLHSTARSVGRLLASGGL
jgi:glycerate kinase